MMRTKILYIIIFFSLSFSLYSGEYMNTYKPDKLLPNITLYYDTVYLKKYDTSYFKLYPYQHYSVDYTVSKYSEYRMFSPFQDEDDWWSNPPGTGSGSGDFVGGLPIGEGVGLLLIFSLLYFIIRTKYRNIN